MYYLLLHSVRLNPSIANLVSAGGSLSFECKQDVGVVLFLDEPDNLFPPNDTSLPIFADI